MTKIVDTAPDDALVEIPGQGVVVNSTGLSPETDEEESPVEATPKTPKKEGK
jgi:hypothetical protein